MIASTIVSFLNDIGFSEIQIKIYRYLLENKQGTINDIKTVLNLSYTQVYHNLLFLLKKKVIDQTNTKPKSYTRINPKIALSELLNTKYNNLKDRVKNLDEEIKVQESKFGRCLKDVSFYHYSKVNLAIENFYDLIDIAQKEIILTSLPLYILKRFESSLYEATMRGVRLKFYFSFSDFEHERNYLEEITSIFKRLRIEIIQTDERTCTVARFNDQIVNMGNIIIDEDFFNSITFKGEEIFHVDGFRAPMVAIQTKGYLDNNNVIKRIEIEYPESIQNILSVIGGNISIKTRDLSKQSKVGGGKLKEYLQLLIKEGKIKETVSNEGTGRPATYYSLIN